MGHKTLKLLDLTDRLARAEVYQELQVEVADLIHLKDAPPEHVMPDVVKAIATALGFEFGIFWRRCDEKGVKGDGVLVPQVIWHAPFVPNAKPVVEATQGFRLKKGDGLPGKIWSSGTAVWIQDIERLDEREYPRAKFAVSLGLHYGIAFPIVIDAHTLGVLEFYCSELEVPPDEGMLSAMTNIGLRIAQYIRRKELEQELREAKMRCETIFNSSYDAIIIANETGHILAFNPAAEQMFGWRCEETVGQSLDIIVPERYREAHNKGMARIAAQDNTVGSRVIGRVVEVEGLHRDGSEFPIETSVATWKVEGKRFYSAFIRKPRRKVDNAHA